MSMPLTHHRFTVDEYHRMAAAGILTEDDRVELLDGEIVEMTPIGPRHAGAVDRLNRLFNAQLAHQVIVRVQNPIILGDRWEPEPDVALLKPREDFYSTAHPTAQDVLLIVEVAETSAERDRDVKFPAYAAAGIPEVWLVDLERRHIEAYQDPHGEAFGGQHVVGPDGTLTVPQLPDLTIAAAEILG